MTNRWVQLVASVVAMIMIANRQYGVDDVRASDSGSDRLEPDRRLLPTIVRRV